MKTCRRTERRNGRSNEIQMLVSKKNKFGQLLRSGSKFYFSGYRQWFLWRHRQTVRKLTAHPYRIGHLPEKKIVQTILKW